jgi:alpha-L-rhamnosidase
MIKGILRIIGLFVLLLTPAFRAEAVARINAKPVWLAGREREMNLSVGFRGAFKASDPDSAKLKIAASTVYRVFLNGEFLGSGPARAAHGYFRIDEYDLKPRLRKGENIIAVEVAGYNVNTYYTLDQPSFLLAEAQLDGVTVLATGQDREFEAFQIRERLQKVERYSFQRPFTEYYRMKEGYDLWRTSTGVAVTGQKLAIQPPVKLLPRRVAMPDFNVALPRTVYSRGTIRRIKPEKYHRDRSLTGISPVFKGYPESELETVPPSQEIQEIVTDRSEILNKPARFAMPFHLGANDFQIVDMGVNLSGFVGARLRCSQPTRLFLYFDEMLTDGDVKTRQRMNDICNQLVYELDAGEYSFETVEAYTLRYLKIIVLEGECTVEQITLREFAYPENKNAIFVSDSFKLNAIFDAARQSSRQNILDVFMDCPSRERAGWLCDSYFSSIMEREFTGRSDVSYNFLENYALPERFDSLPEGMIPMCYPADHYNGEFIPNWSLWFVIQLDDYARRGGDPALVERLRNRIERLLEYFARFENGDGLLERLERWVFVEWSKANSFTQDVNYPSNMLYAAALDCAARLYHKPEAAQKAEKIRALIRRLSYNGEFFTDNALRMNGTLTSTGNTTEVCQYYAFYFNVATPESHPGLWKKLVAEFGPNRDNAKVYPGVYRANAFMGNYLRMDLLSRYGLLNQMLLELQDYFFYMADKTGTLWEHADSHASCNHGFASYIGHVLYRDVLGISNIDYAGKEITLRFSDIPLDSCLGSIPVGNEMIKFQWQRAGNTIVYSLYSLPEGYKVKIENQGSSKIMKDFRL